MTTDTLTALERGDRAPNFWLPTAEGLLGQFYDRFKGNKVVMVFCPSLSDVALRQELSALIAGLGGLPPGSAHLVVVSRDQGPVPDSLQKADAVTFFSDPEGKISQGYGAQGPKSFLVDPAQRILACHSGGTGHAAAALAALGEPEKSIHAEVLSEQAPVLLLPNVFDDALCLRLIRDWEADNFEGEVITGHPEMTGDPDAAGVQHAIKKRRDHEPKPAFNKVLRQMAGRRIVPELYKAFQFKTGFLKPFLIGCYTEHRGDYFLPHRDNTSKETQNRRFAISINLNDDYEGGCLRFAEFSDRLYRPPKGGAVVFSCSLLHEATPVTRGERYVALSFVFGADDPPPRGPLAR